MRTITENEEHSLREVLKHSVNDMELEGHNLTVSQIEQIYEDLVEDVNRLKEHPISLHCPPSVGDIAAIRADAARHAIKK